jgi:hypothetical protein
MSLPEVKNVQGQGIVSFNLQLFLLSAVILTENSHRYEMRLLLVTVAMAVQTGSVITVEFWGTIRILVAKVFNYKNELSAINLAGVSSEVCIGTRTRTGSTRKQISPSISREERVLPLVYVQRGTRPLHL